MDEIELSKISKIIIDEITTLPAYFNFEDADYQRDESHLSVKEKLELANKRQRFTSFHGWFLRCSWMKKVDILKRLAWCTTNLHTLILILNTIYSATCKDYIYSATQGMNLFISDKILNDNNRSLDKKVLQAIIKSTINWYTSLNDMEQYSIVIDMIQLSDSCIIGKIFYEFVTIFKERYREVFRIQYLEELRQRPPSQGTSGRGKKGKKGKSDKKDKKDKKEKKGKKHKSVVIKDPAVVLEREKEKERLKELEEINVFLNEKFPDNSKDPFTIKLISLLQKWDAFITAYQKKVGLGPPKKESKKKNTGKGKPKKEKISKDIPDEIQLLPIWINKKLISSIDPKTFKNVKKTNKYWGFITKGIKQDNKCRQALNKNCAKLKKGLTICKINKSIPETKLAAKFQKSTEVTDTSIRSSFKCNMQTTNTLVADLYKTCSTFNICGINLESFPRRFFVPEAPSYCNIFNTASRIM